MLYKPTEPSGTTCPDFGNEETFVGNSRIPLGETRMPVVIYRHECDT
jgi:hypothetical protein